MEKWLLINGSPRLNGQCARVVNIIKMAQEAAGSDIEITEFEVGRADVMGCNNCDFCRTDEDCIIDDDMNELIEHFADTDRLILVVPIFFAGLPSQTKAVLDRLQPFYWRWRERREAGEPQPAKRPLTLIVVGDGGDPHGYEPLVTTVKSATATAGFAIEEVIPLIGLKRIKPTDLGKWGGC